ncbi:hypothetical protein VaNZ11_006934 [Volvox africanus]|uniref:Pan3 C-terminal knob domain-containing protein n=1 Tax=Volvox africanus TaxID=51714 RepID=A0ABQ5S3C4_9CHLO|nr:hypothetical protein VaNZ11_006934 [Volvox africanus]
MPGPGQLENASTSLSGKVNAAPFVPSGSLQPKTPGASGGFPESAVKAQPFVPAHIGKGGVHGNAQVAGGAQGVASKSPGTKLAANAAAFVPKQPENNSGKGGRGPGADAAGGVEGPTAASGLGNMGGRGGGPSTPLGASTSTPSTAPTSGRGSVGRGGGGGARGGGGGGSTPGNPGQFQLGRMGNSIPGRGGRGGPMPGMAASSGSGSGSPGPMQARGGRGGRGSPGAGGFVASVVMHAPTANASMMGGGFGAHVSHMGPMPIATYGAGGGSHLPSYRPRDLYMTGPGRAYVGVHFAEEGLKQQLQHRAYMLAAQWQDESTEDTGGAASFRLGPYHTLYPLEEGAMGPSASGGHGGCGAADLPSVALGLRTCLVKGVSSVDGSAAALRRIDPKQVIPTAELLSRARETVEQWAPLANHPNLVGLRAAFPASDSLSQAQAGGVQPSNSTETSALVFAHDFHPGAMSLAAAHLMPQMNGAGLVSAPQPPPEEVVWSYAVQITSALRAAHGCGLLLRPACLHPSKVLLTGFGRLRVGSVGLVDALMGGEPPSSDELHLLMRQDIAAMGSLLLTICCAGAGPAPSLDLVAANYSPELVRLLGALLAAAEGGPLGTWRGLVAALADRAFTELDSAGVSLDHMLGELGKEVDNGRMLRLLTKLNFVTERPGDGNSGQDGDSWSETGDRYVVKLFRDFVFHAAAPETGAPLLDWGLVVEALNKVDAGVHEEILLLARDGQSMLVVTYADVKRCLENAFSELKSAANAAPPPSGSLSSRGVQSGRSNAPIRM